MQAMRILNPGKILVTTLVGDWVCDSDDSDSVTCWNSDCLLVTDWSVTDTLDKIICLFYHIIFVVFLAFCGRDCDWSVTGLWDWNKIRFYSLEGKTKIF